MVSEQGSPHGAWEQLAEERIAALEQRVTALEDPTRPDVAAAKTRGLSALLWPPATQRHREEAAERVQAAAGVPQAAHGRVAIWLPAGDLADMFEFLSMDGKEPVEWTGDVRWLAWLFCLDGVSVPPGSMVVEDSDGRRRYAVLRPDRYREEAAEERVVPPPVCQGDVFRGSQEARITAACEAIHARDGGVRLDGVTVYAQRGRSWLEALAVALEDLAENGVNAVSQPTSAECVPASKIRPGDVLDLGYGLRGIVVEVVPKEGWFKYELSTPAPGLPREGFIRLGGGLLEPTFSVLRRGPEVTP